MWTDEPSITKTTAKTRQTTATPSVRKPTRAPDDKDEVRARNPRRRSEQGKNGKFETHCLSSETQV